MSKKPKLRWFRFSLRTLFVVITLIAVCLGWQASIVCERQALLAEGKARGLWSPDYGHDSHGWLNGLSVRRMMGDKPVPFFIVWDNIEPYDYSTLISAFPEARLYYAIIH